MTANVHSCRHLRQGHGQGGAERHTKGDRHPRRRKRAGRERCLGRRDERVEVGGSVQVKQDRAASVTDSRVNGDILYDENSAALRADRNVVGGNVQAFKNTGGVAFNGNRVDGNLQVQRELAGTDRWRQHSAGQYGGPVRAALIRA